MKKMLIGCVKTLRFFLSFLFVFTCKDALSQDKIIQQVGKQAVSKNTDGSFMKDGDYLKDNEDYQNEILSSQTDLARTRKITEGGGNTAVVIQSGENNSSNIFQSGNGNYAKQKQTGDHNTLKLEQSGDNNTSDEKQIGKYNSKEITQNGKTTKIIIEQVSK